MSSGRFMDRGTSEKKTEIYRNFLEEHNVLEAITKALSKLYLLNERPANPMEFIVQELSIGQPDMVADNAYRRAYLTASKELEALRNEHEAVKKENIELKKQLGQKEETPVDETDTVD